MEKGRELVQLMDFAAEVLGVPTVHPVCGRFHFELDEDWSVRMSADSAGRVRIEPCLHRVPRGRLWCLVGDRSRLADLLTDVRDEVAALA